MTYVQLTRVGGGLPTSYWAWKFLLSFLPDGSWAKASSFSLSRLSRELRGELDSIIQRLPRKELESLLQRPHPRWEFSAEQQAALNDRALAHLSHKEIIIHMMKSLYSQDKWENSRSIRERIIVAQNNREYDLGKLMDILLHLQQNKKKSHWAHELKRRIRNWIKKKKIFDSVEGSGFLCDKSLVSQNEPRLLLCLFPSEIDTFLY